MSERVKLAAKALGYAGAVLLGLDVLWAVIAAHAHPITPYQYMTVMVLLSTLGAVALLIAVLAALFDLGFKYLNDQAVAREEGRLKRAGEILAATERIEKLVSGPVFAASYLNGARQRLGGDRPAGMHYRVHHDDLH